MGLRSFFGILPPRVSYRGVSAPVEPAPIPEKVRLLWYKRTPSDLAVQIGKRVETGQDLARHEKGPFVSTVTGRVEDIGEFQGVDAREYLAITIITEQKDSFDPSLEAIKDFSETKPETLRAAVNRAGFTALSPIIRDPRVWPRVDALIISAMDLDPQSVANQQSFRDNTSEVGTAVKLLARTTEALKCTLAVPDTLAGVAGGASLDGAHVVMVPSVYPNGLPEILARKYGAGLLFHPHNSGFSGNTIVVGLDHALSMVESLRSGRPMLEKTVTFSTGEKEGFKNFRVRIGTPVSELLKMASVEPAAGGKLILNGTMHGYACFSDEQPVTATTESLHVQDPSGGFSFQDTQCTNCGKCNQACPVDLEVNLLGRFSEYGIYDKSRALGAENCIQCGLCAYVCPARRPLVQYITRAKQAISAGLEEPVDMAEAMECNACGPSCPAIRLFDMGSDTEDSPKE
ncbi:MAG: 4Fe-4S dicluster domain-containing protein [Desulfobacteraceae bacterium]|nr:4Fe-4S dicluster domain-containing protein [Desulfobacteraceae bacterium]